MNLEFWAAISGIFIVVCTILYWIIKSIIRLNNYFEKTNKNTINLKGVNSRLLELEKKNYELSFNFNELDKKINNYFEVRDKK